MSFRKQARTAKLLPAELFGSDATTVFVDTKLRLAAAPSVLAALVAPGLRVHLALFKHPQLSPPYTALTWMREEATQISRSKTPRVDSVTRMLEQVRRSEQDALGARGYQVYVDAALIVQRNASRFMSEWAAEYFDARSCDRDQISFARAAAWHAEAWSADGVCALNPRGKCGQCSDGRRVTTVALCHWYRSADVATMRHDVIAAMRRGSGSAWEVRKSGTTETDVAEIPTVIGTPV